MQNPSGAVGRKRTLARKEKWTEEMILWGEINFGLQNTIKTTKNFDHQTLITIYSHSNYSQLAISTRQ